MVAHTTRTHWGDFSAKGLSHDDLVATRAILDIATAGDALFQEVVDRILYICHKRIHGAVAVLDTKPGSGDAWHLNNATPGPDGVWVDDTDQSECDAELTDPNCDTFTPTKVSFPFRNVWVCGAVSTFVIKRGRGFMDVFAEAMADAVFRMTEALENTTFQGNFGDGAPKEFDGLFELINQYNGTGGTPVQVFTPENAVGDVVPANSVSGDLLLEDLDEAIDETGVGSGMGRKIIFATKAGSRIINSRLVAQREYNPGDRITIRGGFRVTHYDDHPIIKTTGINNDMAWGLDGSGNPILTAMSGATGDAATTAIVIVDPDDVFYAELMPMTIEPIGKCTILRTKFEGLACISLVENCPESASMIIGMKAAA